MRSLNIGEKILCLRKEKNITQEQLACMVGVSAGAVSKWETGNSSPDISLLSPLARALNTSLDVLLSFQQDISETEVANIKKELTEIFLHMDYEIGEARCKEYLNEYPNSIYLKLIVAGLIRMYSMMSDEYSDQFVKSKMQYSLSLFQQVVESKDPKFTPLALFSIASIQMSLEKFEESEKALKELSSSLIDPMILYPSLLLKQGKNRDAENLCKKMLLQYLNQSILMLTTLAGVSKDDKDYDKSAFYLDAVNKIESTFKISLSSGKYNYCKLYIKTEQKELAAKWFKAYVGELLITGYDYCDNPYFENIKLEVNPEGQKVIRKKFLKSLIDEDDLKVLAGISEYEQAIIELKAAVAGI